MALKPVLKLKVDELFLRWLSESDTQHVLKANLKQIIKGEPVTASVRPQWPQSPRGRPSSDPSSSTPPCSPITASPRSPRRPVINKASIKQLKQVRCSLLFPRQFTESHFTVFVKSNTQFKAGNGRSYHLLTMIHLSFLVLARIYNIPILKADRPHPRTYSTHRQYSTHRPTT